MLLISSVHSGSHPPINSLHLTFIHLNLKGLAGGSLSGKSSLVHRYLAGYCPKDEVLSGRHKKCLTIDGKKCLLLVRDETGPPDSQVCLLQQITKKGRRRLHFNDYFRLFEKCTKLIRILSQFSRVSVIGSFS